MPISHEHKCIFFHIPKCAGSSIESRLGVGEDDVNEIPDYDILWGRHRHDLYDVAGPVVEQDGKTVFLYVELQHLTPEQMLAGEYVSQDVFDSYYKFTFIRNPWDRLVSEYFWKTNRFDNFRAFLDWIAALDMSSELNQYPHFIPQHRFVYNHKDRPMVNFVGKYEELFQGWESVRKKLEIETKGLPRLLQSEHKPYVEYYDKSTADVVAQIYQRDIELFGYKFGE